MLKPNDDWQPTEEDCEHVRGFAESISSDTVGVLDSGLYLRNRENEITLVEINRIPLASDKETINMVKKSLEAIGWKFSVNLLSPETNNQIVLFPMYNDEISEDDLAFFKSLPSAKWRGMKKKEMKRFFSLMEKIVIRPPGGPNFWLIQEGFSKFWDLIKGKKDEGEGIQLTLIPTPENYDSFIIEYADYRVSDLRLELKMSKEPCVCCGAQQLVITGEKGYRCIGKVLSSACKYSWSKACGSDGKCEGNDTWLVDDILCSSFDADLEDIRDVLDDKDETLRRFPYNDMNEYFNTLDIGERFETSFAVLEKSGKNKIKLIERKVGSDKDTDFCLRALKVLAGYIDWKFVDEVTAK